MISTEDDYRAMELQDLFNEILNLAQGDLWDGFQSKTCRNNELLAKKVFGERMRVLGIEWI